MCCSSWGRKELDRTEVKRMFTAALFTIAKTWKQPRCPSTNEWIKKIRYIYTIEYYWATKKNKIMPFATTWMQLEIFTLSKGSQKEKDKYHIDTISIWNLRYATNEPIYETETESST